MEAWLETLKVSALALLANPDAVMGIIAAVLLLAFGEWDVRKKISELIPQAEDQLELVGIEKRDWVVEKLYALLPPAIKIFVPKALISALVQHVFDNAFKALDKSAAQTEGK